MPTSPSGNGAADPWKCCASQSCRPAFAAGSGPTWTVTFSLKRTASCEVSSPSPEVTSTQQDPRGCPADGVAVSPLVRGERPSQRALVLGADGPRLDAHGLHARLAREGLLAVGE